MSIFSKIKFWFRGAEPERSGVSVAVATAANISLNETEEGKAIGKLKSQAILLAGELFPILGREKLTALIEEQTKDTLISGTKINEQGVLDFREAEERYLKLPPLWLKLVEKFLYQLIDVFELTLVGHGAQVVANKKAVISVTPQVREMISSVGLGALITRGVIEGIEMELVDKSGNIKPVMVGASALKDENGNIQGMVIAAKDMTEIQKLQKEKLEILEKAKDEAEQAVEQRTKELEDTVKRLKSSEQQQNAANQQLNAANQQLNAANQQLSAAQKNLQDKLLELERFNKVAVGRELRMVELKEEISRLKMGTQKPMVT